jgi:hypothetical protein
LELPATLFEEITGCNPAGLGPVKVEDRRRACRVPLLSRAAIYPTQTEFGQSAVVYLNDVSVLGVGFLHRQSMNVGRDFILQLPRKRGSAVMILCVVKRCEACGPRFFVGASFTRILSPDAEVTAPNRSDELSVA